MIKLVQYKKKAENIFTTIAYRKTISGFNLNRNNNAYMNMYL